MTAPNAISLIKTAHGPQGDLDDRKKILAADIRREKELEMQREADDLAMEARTLATMGWTVEEIAAELQRINVRPTPCPALCP